MWRDFVPTLYMTGPFWFFCFGLMGLGFWICDWAYEFERKM